MSITKGQPVELCEGLGERIREEREKRGWSERELADRATAKGVSVSHGAIGNYENGGMPTAPRLVAVALALGVNPLYLIDKRAAYTWDPQGDGGLMAAHVRRVAHWMLDYAKGDGPIEVLSEKESPVLEDPRKEKDGKRGVGTPRAADG